MTRSPCRKVVFGALLFGLLPFICFSDLYYKSMNDTCNFLQAVVDAGEVEKYINWHRIVINRSMSFLPSNIAATHIAAFFHKKVPTLPPCCLLDQVVTHCLAGITAASKRSVNGVLSHLLTVYVCPQAKRKAKRPRKHQNHVNGTAASIPPAQQPASVPLA
jgi:hypothetical protein